VTADTVLAAVLLVAAPVGMLLVVRGAFGDTATALPADWAVQESTGLIVRSEAVA
jgi:hypothetical protein